MPLRRFTLLAAALALAACGKPAADAPKPVAAARPAADATPAPLSSPLEIGSQAARDAYYCAGILEAAYPQPEIALSPNDMAQVFRAEAQAITLRMDGFGKLMDEKAVLAPQAGQVADAWSDVAAKEFAEKKPRLTLKACEAMVNKLPAN